MQTVIGDNWQQLDPKVFSNIYRLQSYGLILCLYINIFEST